MARTAERAVPGAGAGSLPQTLGGATSPQEEMRVTQRDFGRISLLVLRGGDMELAIRPEHGPESVIYVVFVDAGTLSYRDRGTWVRINARVIVSPDDVHRLIKVEGDWQMVAVRVPRSALESFGADIPTRVTMFDRQILLDESLRAFVAATARSTRVATAIDTYAVAQLVTEMVGAMLLSRMGTCQADEDPKSRLFAQAMAVVAQQSKDPDLTPVVVANEVGVSLRHLQAVFSGAGTTVATEIRRQRGRTARDLLLDRRFDVLSIDAIAEHSGFGTAMSMRRALSDLYRTSPRGIRRERRGAS